MCPCPMVVKRMAKLSIVQRGRPGTRHRSGLDYPSSLWMLHSRKTCPVPSSFPGQGTSEWARSDLETMERVSTAPSELQVLVFVNCHSCSNMQSRSTVSCVLLHFSTGLKLCENKPIRPNDNQKGIENTSRCRGGLCHQAKWCHVVDQLQDDGGEHYFCVGKRWCCRLSQIYSTVDFSTGKKVQ